MHPCVSTAVLKSPGGPGCLSPRWSPWPGGRPSRRGERCGWFSATRNRGRFHLCKARRKRHGASPRGPNRPSRLQSRPVLPEIVNGMVVRNLHIFRGFPDIFQAEHSVISKAGMEEERTEVRTEGMDQFPGLCRDARLSTSYSRLDPVHRNTRWSHP